MHEEGGSPAVWVSCSPPVCEGGMPLPGRLCEVQAMETSGPGAQEVPGGYRPAHMGTVHHTGGPHAPTGIQACTHKYTHTHLCNHTKHTCTCAHMFKHGGMHVHPMHPHTAHACTCVHGGMLAHITHTLLFLCLALQASLFRKSNLI